MTESRDKCKVVHVTNAHPADDPRILYREALGAASQGYLVLVVGPYDRAATIENLAIIPLHKFKKLLFRVTFGAWWAILRAVLQRPRLIHFHDPDLLPAALAAKLLVKVPVVYDAHEDVSLIMLKDWIPQRFRRPLTRMADLIDRFFARRVDAVVVPTRGLLSRYQQFAKRVECFYNFPAPSFLRERDKFWSLPDRRENMVVHLGTVSFSRLEFLMKLARQFLDRHPKWKWSFIGLHPPHYRWFGEHVEGSFGDRLTAMPKISHLEVCRVCCRAKIGINYHVLSSQQVQVAIPLKVFEYLACGLSVITTKVPALWELVRDCPAVRFVKADLDEYLEALEVLTRDGDHIQSMASAAREFVEEHFDCTAEAERLAALYDAILNDSPK